MVKLSGGEVVAIGGVVVRSRSIAGGVQRVYSLAVTVSSAWWTEGEGIVGIGERRAEQMQRSEIVDRMQLGV